MIGRILSPLDRSIRIAVMLIAAPLTWPSSICGANQEQPATISQPEKTSRDTDIDATIRTAFAATHQGYSVDEVLITDELRHAFIDRVKQTEAAIDEGAINLTLLRLRKTGKLKVRSTKQGRRADTNYQAAAEIGARMTADRTGRTTDEMIADPNTRQQLLDAAQQVAPSATPYDVLKHVLNLRKARRLKPELVLRVADWPRQITVTSIQQLSTELNTVPETPGVYLFRTVEGYLYIGEASNLRNRMQQHLNPNGVSPLSEYITRQSSESITIELHSFPQDSPGAKLSMRRAYESELIRSRAPKLNVRP